MNKQRRKQIDLAMYQLEQLKSEIDDLYQEEQDAWDNLPEGIQDSERGEAMAEAADYLETAGSAVSEAIENLGQAKGDL